MEAPSGNQVFSSIAGGIVETPAQTPQAPVLATPVETTTTPASATSETATPVPVIPDTPSPTKRPIGRPKGSKNKVHLEHENKEKRPVGRPRGSGKKKTESDTPQEKRPVGRPRKDGLPSGSPAKGMYSTLVPPMPDYYRIGPSNVPIHQWVPAFPESISAPLPPRPAPVIDPALQRNEWAELAHSNPDEFLHVLLAALDVPTSAATFAGPSVEEVFKSHLGSLAPQPSSSGSNASNDSTPAPANTVPSLYSLLKTFWLPSSPSYFALTASASSARTPASHRFLYWDPQPLVFNGIACPTCAAPLTNRGRIRSGPITIHDLSGPFFVIGCNYACPAGHAYASTDAAVRRALPAALEREFPARLVAGDAGVGADVWNWQARGVSRAMWNLVLGALRAGLARDVILQLVRDVHNGVPESVGSRKQEEQEEQRAAAPMEEEEEETAEEAGEGEGDVVMAPNEDTEELTVSSTTQAFNDTVSPSAFNNAWAANSGAPSSSSIPVGDLRDNPYARLALYPAMMAYDSNQRKRAYPFGDEASGSGANASNGSSTEPGVTLNTNKPRNPRHCCKCGSQNCKGKGGRTFCTSPCMDCGKFTCRGRNSRRPDKRCDQGWPGEPQQELQVPAPAPAENGAA
ncbi:hypothetical protein C8R43DRAFT_976664 [Mycena crocata]|nr:hypothetical protein C8R43DRAFT_976664 [Mycena crocata]